MTKMSRTLSEALYHFLMSESDDLMDHTKHPWHQIALDKGYSHVKSHYGTVSGYGHDYVHPNGHHLTLKSADMGHSWAHNASPTSRIAKYAKGAHQTSLVSRLNQTNRS